MNQIALQRKPRHYLRVALRVALVTACLTYVVWGLDLASLGQSLMRYSVGAALFVALVSLAACGLAGARLNFLMQGRPGVLRAFAAAILALGVNNLLPARLGELAKVFYLTKHSGMQPTRILGIVFWERFFDFNALLLLSLVVVASLKLPLLITPLAGGVVAVWALVISLRIWSSNTRILIGRLPYERLSRNLLEIHQQVQSGLSIGTLLGLSVFTASVWTLYSAQALLAILWVANISVTMNQAFAVFVVAALGFSIPGTPGGIGLFEAAIVFSLGLFGVQKEDALAVGLLMRVTQFLPATLGAIIIIARTELSLKTIFQRAQL